MHRKLRIGIVGPCPPPHGGVTRIIRNHLQFWEDLPVETWLIPVSVPIEPAVYPQTKLVERANYVGVRPRIRAAARVGWRFGLCRWTSLENGLAFDITVREAIRKYQFDIVYAHHAYLPGLVAVNEARRMGIPSVLVAYGETWLATHRDRRWRRSIDYSVSHADWVVSTSEHCRRGAVARGAALERTSVIYAGIDLERFRPGLDGNTFRALHGIPEDAVVISVLGLTLKRKLDTFLDSLHLLLEDPRTYVMIGGTGKDTAYLAERVSLVPGGRVRTLGFVPEKDLPHFYHATDILVVAPNTVVECMGQSMKEAMSCGRAVVGARLGGVPEALGAEGCGLMFEPDSPEDLSRVLQPLIDDPGQREQMGLNGRKVAEERFDARASAQQTFELLSRMVVESLSGP